MIQHLEGQGVWLGVELFKEVEDEDMIAFYIDCYIFSSIY